MLFIEQAYHKKIGLLLHNQIIYRTRMSNQDDFSSTWEDVHPQVVIAGVGKLGTAILHCKEVEEGDITIVAAFDSDPAKQDPKAAIPVLPLEQLIDVVVKHRITIGIIALPDDMAQRAADLMILGGIRGILNFSSTRLYVPKNCVERHVNFALELKKLFSFVNASNSKGGSLQQDRSTIDD